MIQLETLAYYTRKIKKQFSFVEVLVVIIILAMVIMLYIGMFGKPF